MGPTNRYSHGYTGSLHLRHYILCVLRKILPTSQVQTQPTPLCLTIDDILGVWQDSPLHLNAWVEFQDDLQRQCRLNWTIVQPRKSVDFLDLTITLTDSGTILTSTFQKPTRCIIYFNFNCVFLLQLLTKQHVSVMHTQYGLVHCKLGV